MTHQLQKLNYSHEALIDQIMANPAATNQQLGDVFGRTKEWVGMVKNSGMFKEAYALRTGKLMDPVLVERYEERLDMMATRSLEVLTEKLAKPSADIPDELALQAAALGAKIKGIGGFSSRPPPAPVAPTAGRLERLADRLLVLRAQPPAPVQDIPFVEMAQGAAE